MGWGDQVPLNGSVLEHSPESKHLVYLDSRAQSISCGSSGNTTSLTELLSLLQQQKMASEATLSSFERVRLAKQLATAVLQFHATPWLKGSWRSSQVYLYGIDSARFQAISDMNEPYLDVSVTGPPWFRPHVIHHAKSHTCAQSIPFRPRRNAS